MAWFVMLQDVMKISEKTEEGTDVFPFCICERSVYKCEIAAENESVAVQNVNCIFVECHKMSLTD